MSTGNGDLPLSRNTGPRPGLLKNLFPPLLMLFLGSILLVPSAYQLYTYEQFLCNAVPGTGVVDKPMSGSDLGGRPFVQFRDLQGQVFGFKTKAKTHWFFAPQKGEKINILFLPEKPETVIVDNKFHYLVLPLVFFLIGGAVCFYALRLGWRELRSGRES